MVRDVGHHRRQGGWVERSVSYTFEKVGPGEEGAKVEGVVYSGKRRRRACGPTECRTHHVTSIARRQENITSHSERGGGFPYRCQWIRAVGWIDKSIEKSAFIEEKAETDKKKGLVPSSSGLVSTGVKSLDRFASGVPHEGIGGHEVARQARATRTKGFKSDQVRIDRESSWGRFSM
jgi:hypothetical protein